MTSGHKQQLNQLIDDKSVDPSIIKTVAILLSDKNRSQFKIEQNDPKNPNSFTINPLDPQNITISGSNMIFKDGRTYNLNNPDLQYFITNTNIERAINDIDTIANFLYDMGYDATKGDKKSDRYRMIRDLDKTKGLGEGQVVNRAGDLNSLHGVNRDSNRNRDLTPQSEVIFLPSNPNELVDRFQLLYQEIIGGNDNPKLKQEITAIVDKLFEYNCITSDLHAALLAVGL